MEHKLMSLEEIAEVSVRAIEMEEAGQVEEGNALYRTIPLAPHLAMFVKKYLGAEKLIQMDWNLAEAEAEFGAGWLNR